MTRHTSMGLWALIGLTPLAGCQAGLDLDPPSTDAAPDTVEAGRPDRAVDDGTERPDDGVAPADDGVGDGPPIEACEDEDGDGRGPGCAQGPDCDDSDETVWPGAPESCDGRDEDCDGAVDEAFPGLGGGCGVGLGGCLSQGTLVCAAGGDGLRCEGEARAPEDERCNEQDDDCDGQVDEGVAGCCTPGELRACGESTGACTPGQQACGPDRIWGACSGQGPVVETCEGTDQDCDGRTDEGLLNACGGCGAVPREQCNGADDDCDGRTDEGVTNACGACGAVPAEQCNGADDDCDGRTDEGVQNACGACGAVPSEQCNGADDDCDGRTDEGVQNACGACGAVPAEACNGRDDDCDGRTDEGVQNACGECGAVPAEACNGRDDDCDGRTDEGVTNACGGCWEVVPEICNGVDDDCNGTPDNGVCAPAVDACANPALIQLNQVVTGPIGGGLDLYYGALDDGDRVGDGPERAFRFVPPATATYCLDLSGSDFDTVLYVRLTCSQDGFRVAWDDDDGPGTTSRLATELTVGTPYFVFVDAYDQIDRGTFQLQIRQGACP